MSNQDRVCAAIEEIVPRLKQGKLANEEQVKHGAILPLLLSLGWDIFDIDQVKSEHPTGDGRIDYALFPGIRQAERPCILIEAKGVGLITPDSEEQLLRYGFAAEGAPMLILTDGQEWNFYLSQGAGKFNERLFHKINILEQDSKKSADIFCTYLSYDDVVSGESSNRAEKVLKKQDTKNIINKSVPKAWRQLLEGDDMLRDLLAKEIKNICGHIPEIEIVDDFLRSCIDKSKISASSLTANKKSSRTRNKSSNILKGSSSTNLETTDDNQNQKTPKYILVYRDQKHETKFVIGILEKAIILLANETDDFLFRLWTRTNTPGGTKLIAKNRDDLFPESPYLVEQGRCTEIKIKHETWWLNKLYSSKQVFQKLEICCEVAGVVYGKDLKIIKK